MQKHTKTAQPFQFWLKYDKNDGHFIRRPLWKPAGICKNISSVIRQILTVAKSVLNKHHTVE